MLDHSPTFHAVHLICSVAPTHCRPIIVFRLYFILVFFNLYTPRPSLSQTLILIGVFRWIESFFNARKYTCRFQWNWARCVFVGANGFCRSFICLLFNCHFVSERIIEIAKFAWKLRICLLSVLPLHGTQWIHYFNEWKRENRETN